MTNPYIALTGKTYSPQMSPVAQPNMSPVPSSAYSSSIKITNYNDVSSLNRPTNATQQMSLFGGRSSFGNAPAQKANMMDAGKRQTTNEAFDVNQWLSANNLIDEGKFTGKQIKNFASGTINLMKGITSVYNGYIAAEQYEMQAANKRFQAEQTKRAAKLLRQNIRDIDRAAQADANVYRLEGVKTKSAQRVAQASSGFAVGKGTYKVMLDTTDARTNYNASMIMLKAGLQNAEVLRQAGTLEAQAILEAFDAEALEVQADHAINQGWMDGIMKGLESGVDFYLGYKGE